MAFRVDIENRVNPAAPGGERFQAADFGAEQIGRAVQGFGQNLAQAADRQNQLDMVYDEAATKRADSEAMTRIAEVKRTYRNMQGFDAVGAPDKFREDIGKVKAEYMASLANDRQRAMFSDVFDRRTLADYTDIADHADKQVFAAGRAADVAFGETHMTRAVDAAINGNSEEAAASLATVEATIRKVNRGAGEEVIGQQIAKAKSGWATQVGRALLQDDPVEAKAWVDEHAADLLPEDETALRKEMRPQLEEAEGDAMLGQIIAEVQGAGSAGAPPATTPEEDAEAGDKAAAHQANPVRGKQTSGFYDKRPGGRQHSAFDIAAPAGTPVYPPTGGKVTKVWNDAAGGNSILVEHPDGRVTGYAHLRNVNVEIGQVVEPNTVLGGVGNTGSASRGNHLHFTVRNANGVKVDPATQRWTNRGSLPPKPQVARLDQAGMIDAAYKLAERNNWTPRQLKNALDQIGTYVGQSDRLQARAEKEAEDAAWEVVNGIEAGGGELTSVSQIPGFGRLPADVQIRMRNYADANKKGEAVAAGGDTFIDLLEMSGNASTQQIFANMDLNGLRGQMSKGEFSRLRAAQVSIRNGGGAQSQTAANFSRIDSFVRRYAPEAGIAIGNNKKALDPANRAKRAQLTERVRSAVEERQKEANRQLTDAEIDSIVRAQTVAVFVPGKVDGAIRPVEISGERYSAVPRYTVGAGKPYRVSVNEIPQGDRREIEAALRRAGRPVTNDAVIALYLRAN